MRQFFHVDKTEKIYIKRYVHHVFNQSFICTLIVSKFNLPFHLYYTPPKFDS